MEGDIWILDVVRGTLTRFTVGGGQDPEWTPDGRRIAFTGPQNALFWKAADGSDDAELLTTDEQQQFTGSWSPDGQVLAFTMGPPRAGDIWMRPLDGVPAAFLATPFNETRPEFSPAGDWLAYVSNESGRDEIYLRPYPGPGGRIQVSTDGGREPAWSPDGRELFYRDSRGDLMIVPLEIEAALTVGQPQQLIRGGGVYRTSSAAGSRYYDVAPDGQTFVMVGRVGDMAREPQIHVVLNWHQELNERVPVP